MTSQYEALLQVVRDRRSIRRFRPDPVAPADVNRILEAARWAPTASNRQAFRFLVVRAPDVIKQMAEAVERACRSTLAEVRTDAAHDAERYLKSFSHFVSAPVVLAPIYRSGFDMIGAVSASGSSAATSERARLDSLASVCAATMNILLAAHSLGLGTCWMTGPLLAAPELAAILAVPEGWELAAILPVGYPDESPAPPKRRPLARLTKTITSSSDDEETSR